MDISTLNRNKQRSKAIINMYAIFMQNVDSRLPACKYFSVFFYVFVPFLRQRIMLYESNLFRRSGK